MTDVRHIIDIEVLKYYAETHGIKPRNCSKEAAHILGCHDDTLRKSRSTGYLFGVPAPRHIKTGHTVKYTLKDLVAWLEQNNTSPSDGEAA